MKSRPETLKHRDKRRTANLKATLDTLLGMSYTHFPLILPGVHPLASFFILRRLKGLGFSNCRVVTSENGLVVHAHR